MKIRNQGVAGICEICGKSAVGRGHPECSKKRQALHATEAPRKVQKTRTLRDKDQFAAYINRGVK